MPMPPIMPPTYWLFAQRIEDLASVVAGLTLAAGPVGVLAADRAHAQTKQTAPEKSLYDRLGGVFAIAAVVDHFSDAVVKNPSSARSPRARSCANGTPRTWEG